MPLSTNPGDELNKKKTLTERRQPLIDRMDADFALGTLDEFTIPKEEGKFDIVTSNRARIESERAINYLSYAKRRIFIPIDEENVTGRSRINKTEDAVNGFLFAAEKSYDGIPEHPCLQAVKSFYAVYRGWTADLLYMYEDEDGNAVCHYAVWDPRNVVYVSGSRGLLWVCATRWDNADSVKYDYPGWNGKADSNGLVEISNVFDCSEKGKEAQEAIIIDGEYVKEPEDIGLDYIPARIKAGNSMPYVVAGTDSTIKHIGESFFANNRALYAYESRLLSYNMTRAGILAKPPMKVKYSSDKGADAKPEYDINPGSKGAEVPVDTFKGQDLEIMNANAPGQNITEMLVQIQQTLNTGGITSLLSPPYPDTAAGTDIVAHETMSKIQPFVLHLQADFVWSASEIANQFKGGQYATQEVEGLNSTYKRFKSKAKPDDMVTDRQIECQLIPDILRDKNMMIGIFKEGVASGAWSRKTGRDICQLVDDPDREEELIAMERVEELAQVGGWSAVAALIKDAGTKATPEAQLKRIQAQIIVNELMKAAQPQPSPAGPGQPAGPAGPQNAPGVTAPMPPSAGNAAQRRPNVPPEVTAAARRV